MVNDYLSDLIARINNGYRARAERIVVPAKKTSLEVLKVLAEEGYITSVKKQDEGIQVELKYLSGGEGAIMGIRVVSKPSARIYRSIINMPKVWGGLGINILSTNKGIMSHRKAKKVNCGGELIAQVW